METGEWLTRTTVWLALTLYMAGESVNTGWRGHRSVALAWWLSAIGCLFFLAHVVCAFHYFHNWSHAMAYESTAQQTRQLTGWKSGSGLYLNYFFGLLWTGEMVWSRLTPSGHAARPSLLAWAVRGFFLFMIFNGAFVFVRSPLRWGGLFLCLVLLSGWWLGMKRGMGPKQPPKSNQC